ncbi:MAG: DNA repair protein RecO [Deltaproteobacteria bacterium]|jgi:DNA repair protein RecO (recombination protein O)|nr:DNA repair protein RecO [Deltaproteobacteria bacterium]
MPKGPSTPLTKAPPSQRLGAIVLYRIEVGEADLIVTFLTREMGIISAYAKNARKSVKRFGGGLLAPGAAAYYFFRIRENRDLYFVERGEMNPKAPVLPPDPLIQLFAAQGLELTRAFEVPKNPAVPTFNLLIRYLDKLAHSEELTPPYLALRTLALAFHKLYLEISGFGLTFSHCALCGKLAQDENWFWDKRHPRLLCPECAQGHGRLPQIPGALTLALSQIKDFKNLPTLTEPQVLRAEELFQSRASLEAGKIFKSYSVLQDYLHHPKEA